MSFDTLIYVLVFAPLVAALIFAALKPLLSKKRRIATTAEVARSLGLQLQQAKGSTFAKGVVEGRRIEVEVFNFGCIVTAEMTRSPIGKSITIYDSTGWSYQKQEGWDSGHAKQTGNASFDAKYIVYGEGLSAWAIPPDQREFLVRNHQRGLRIDHQGVAIGTGTPTPYGYLGGQSSPSAEECMSLAKHAIAVARGLDALLQEKAR